MKHFDLHTAICIAVVLTVLAVLATMELLRGAAQAAWDHLRGEQ